MWLRMKNFNIMAVHGKIRFLGGGEGFREEPIYREELPKKGGGLDSLQV